MKRVHESTTTTTAINILKYISQKSKALSLSLSSRLGVPVKRQTSSGFTIVELLIVIVVIAILAAITIVAYTGISDRAKDSARASELAQWKKTAELHKIQNNIECPDNYVFIYGNSALGTNDFCVMKYEAKNVGGVAASQAAGTPWVSISQTSAISTSQAACSGCHLLTEAEWMTIAADVLSVKYNWTGGEVGNGFIQKGHVNNNPGSALAASTDDTDTTFGITGGTGDTINHNGPRTLYLTSGDVIWDLSGNVWEWTNATISGSGSQPSPTNWKEYTAVTNWGSLTASSRPSALASTAGLSGIASWNANQGIGRLYSDTSLTNTRAFRRGGLWGSAGYAGVLALNLSHTPSNTSSGIGFRVAR